MSLGQRLLGRIPLHAGQPSRLWLGPWGNIVTGFGDKHVEFLEGLFLLVTGTYWEKMDQDS